MRAAVLDEWAADDLRFGVVDVEGRAPKLGEARREEQEQA